MQKLNDLSRSPSPLDPDGTLIAVIELSLSSWLVAGIVPGVERQPLKKLAVDESALLKLLHRWREEAAKAGHRIKRIAVAFEAGRDGFRAEVIQCLVSRGASLFSKTNCTAPSDSTAYRISPSFVVKIATTTPFSFASFSTGSPIANFGIEVPLKFCT